jgi:hypothetical protein
MLLASTYFTLIFVNFGDHWQSASYPLGSFNLFGDVKPPARPFTRTLEEFLHLLAWPSWWFGFSAALYILAGMAAKQQARTMTEQPTDHRDQSIAA